MDQTFLIFILMFLLTGCHSKPARKPRQVSDATKHPVVHFSLDGNLFQMRLLSQTQSYFDNILDSANSGDATNTYVEDGQTATQYAVIRVIPKVSPPKESGTRRKFFGNGKSKAAMKTFDRMKSLYEEFGKMLKVHEDELQYLMSGEERALKESPAVSTSTKGGTEVAAKSKNKEIPVTEKEVESGPLEVSRPKDNSGDNLNIHVHAEPPLKMRTIIGYPQKSSKSQVAPLHKQQANIRIIQRDTASSSVYPDYSYESGGREGADHELSNSEESFLRRGSALLLNMWKRFQSHKSPNVPDEQEQQNFNEEFLNTDDT